MHMHTHVFYLIVVLIFSVFHSQKKKLTTSQIWITLDHINTLVPLAKLHIWRADSSEGRQWNSCGLLLKISLAAFNLSHESCICPASSLLLPGQASLFSVGFYPLCHVCFCYSFSEILVAETRGRLPSNNKITMDDLAVFSNYITRGKLNSLGLPQLLTLKSVHGCCLWLAPLSPWTHNPRLFPHKMLTPPWLLHHHQEPSTALHSCPKSSSEPGRNLTLPSIFQHRILKFSWLYPHLDHFHLEEGEIDKPSALDMLQWQRCLAITYNTYVKHLAILPMVQNQKTPCSHLRSILRSHRNLLFFIFWLITLQ